ncbi:hypothetical protein [Pseudonocardia sp. WMMC193]|uniref:hypothetical protein n=1 Tax=Pseudonocardia sp. WMMC193 TaxID=2911965 RepID=UPI001F1CCB9F|nr:hypothetical protein [Pseudonocardia sp. WMMC193]MCF7553721.1 hypothetical protein [Pseudonocardia sp. WMMC193]
MKRWIAVLLTGVALTVGVERARVHPQSAWDATDLMPVIAATAVISLALLSWTAHLTARKVPS